MPAIATRFVCQDFKKQKFKRILINESQKEFQYPRNRNGVGYKTNSV
jgi:hypothetical protein